MGRRQSEERFPGDERTNERTDERIDERIDERSSSSPLPRRTDEQSQFGGGIHSKRRFFFVVDRNQSRALAGLKGTDGRTNERSDRRTRRVALSLCDLTR